MYVRLIQLVCLSLLVAVSATGCKRTVNNATTGFRVAMALPGKITDRSWNQAGYEGLKRVEAEVQAEVAFTEQVAQPDQAETMSDYARRGYGVVIGHGGEFQDAALQAADRHPDTLFLVNNGTKTAANVGVIGFHQRQPGYLVGYIAGKISKSGKVGFLGGQKIKAYEELAEGFQTGVNAANPKAEVLVTWTNDWDDVAKGKEAALLQIGQGADVIFPTMDNATLGSLQAAKEKNVRAIGIYYDAIKDWPGTIVQSAIIDIRGAMVETLKKVKAGDMKGKEYRYGIETPGAVRLGSYDASVPQSVRDEVDKMVERIKKGELTP